MPAQKAATPADHNQQALPVTHVSLYKNGVGFFEHTGREYETLANDTLAAHTKTAAFDDFFAYNDTLKSLHDDEDRERQNITALANADKSSRDRFVQELNKTEDAITSAQSEQATRQAALDAAKAELSQRIENFSLDETVS